MSKFRTQFTADYQGSQGEINNLESVTIPDMNLTIRQLLINHTRGIGSDEIYKEGIYSDIEIPRFTDLNDMEDYKEMLLQKQEELEAQIKHEKSEARKKRDSERNPKDKNDVSNGGQEVKKTDNGKQPEPAQKDDTSDK